MKIDIDSFATLISGYAEELLTAHTYFRTAEQKADLRREIWHTVARQHPDLVEAWLLD